MNDILDFYAAQSIFSDPGRTAGWLDGVPDGLADIRRLATQLVFHYRASGDPLEHGFTPDRLAEIDLRYAEDAFARLQALRAGSITAAREPTQCILGCCRDFTLLFVAMARNRGIPARARVGFAGYFDPSWWYDHVVAEVWDDVDKRWRLVEAQIPDGYVDLGSGRAIDPLDVPRDRFLVGADAWRAVRSGAMDPARSGVAPNLDLPFLQSWTYIAHNLVFDLAALNKREMVLWETWGVLDSLEPPDATLAADLDVLAAWLADPLVSLDQIRALYDDDRMRVPASVTNHSPFDGSSRVVDLRTVSLVEGAGA